MNNIYILSASFFLIASTAKGQNLSSQLFDNISAELSMSGTASSGDYAPLWLSANSFGLNSVEANSAYQRININRPAETDSNKIWKVEYGLDLSVHENSVSTINLNQYYAAVQFKKLKMTVGAKHHNIDLRNNELTSGGLAMGINARPIPQIRLESDYFSIPGTNHWWKWKGRLSYGAFSDNSWIENFHNENDRYALNTLYHEKALYWKFGKEDVFPLTFEIGIQMAAQFAGKTYNAIGRNIQERKTLNHPSGLKAFWDVLWASGSDETDGVDLNTAGNHLGSYNMALNYRGKTWGIRTYFERYFEDQSMLTLQYGIYDHLLGFECCLPKNRFVSSFLIEHMSTKDQSGAVYHDATSTMPEKMNGRDNYYNHSLYNGWQHWGQTLGHPFLTSPIYSHAKAYDLNGYIYFKNNRVQAWHFALSGEPSSQFHYRMLCSLTRNWGIYNIPFQEVYNQIYLMAETTYNPLWWKQGHIKMGVAYDHGKVLGDSFGVQLTLLRKLQL